MESFAAMRRVCASLLVLLPLVAAGQTVAADGRDALARAGVARQAPAEVYTISSSSMLLPVWQADDGQSWALLTRSAAAPVSASAQPLAFHGLGFASQRGTGFQYMLNPRWAAHASVNQQSWVGPVSVGSCLSDSPAVRQVNCAGNRLAPKLLGSEIGATFVGNGYSVGVDVSATRPTASTPLLPRVLPTASPLHATVNGLPYASLQGSTSLHARGRVALGEGSGIDLGASVGRIRLLPGNLLGINTLGQKSLSLGVDSGPVSGRIVGRIIQPESGPAANLLGPDRRWTSIDLGVTLQLPWQGSLSFGAQNVWSSGHVPKPKKGPPAPEQSSIPYVQYHQDF